MKTIRFFVIMRNDPLSGYSLLIFLIDSNMQRIYSSFPCRDGIQIFLSCARANSHSISSDVQRFHGTEKFPQFSILLNYKNAP